MKINCQKEEGRGLGRDRMGGGEEGFVNEEGTLTIRSLRDTRPSFDDNLNACQFNA